MAVQPYLFFNGRRNEMIKTAGANVAPREVELLLAAMPGVVEAAVLGLPDARLGEMVCAEAAATVMASSRVISAPMLCPPKNAKAPQPHTAPIKPLLMAMSRLQYRSAFRSACTRL